MSSYRLKVSKFLNTSLLRFQKTTEIKRSSSFVFFCALFLLDFMVFCLSKRVTLIKKRHTRLKRREYRSLEHCLSHRRKTLAPFGGFSLYLEVCSMINSQATRWPFFPIFLKSSPMPFLLLIHPPTYLNSEFVA